MERWMKITLMVLGIIVLGIVAVVLLRGCLNEADNGVRIQVGSLN